MKNLFLGSLLAVCALLMTSCLDGGKNESTEAYYGVIGYSDKSLKPVVYTPRGVLYSPEIEKNVISGVIQPDDCCFIGVHINFDSPENSPEAYASKGYYTVNINQYIDVRKGTFYTQLQDTAVVDTAEMLVAAIDMSTTGLLGIKKDRPLFVVGTYHDDYIEDQEQVYTLSYDPDQEPEVVNGEKVYNLYLRVVKTEEGKKTLSSMRELLNSFDARPFLNAVKNKEEKQVNFRINCVKKLNEDKTKITDWTVSDVLTYTFLAEENND